MTIFNEPVMSPKDFCDRTGLTRQTVMQWIKRGGIKAYKVLGRYYIPESAITTIIRDAKEAE